jgi:hypothetical protein
VCVGGVLSRLLFFNFWDEPWQPATAHHHHCHFWSAARAKLRSVVILNKILIPETRPACRPSRSLLATCSCASATRRSTLDTRFPLRTGILLVLSAATRHHHNQRDRGTPEHCKPCSTDSNDPRHLTKLALTTQPACDIASSTYPTAHLLAHDFSEHCPVHIQLAQSTT